MVPNMKPLSCSMHLFLPSEEKTAELGRKRYKSLKKDLEARGLKEIGDWLDWMQAINIEGIHFWPLLLAESNSLSYNPPLLSAIAGQRPEGGVGCWYKHNTLGHIFCVDHMPDENHDNVLGHTINGGSFVVSEGYKLNYDFHLATIEELMTAFPPTCEENEQVEPEPRKIKKGDRLLCVSADGGPYLTQGAVYIAATDEIPDDNSEPYLTIEKSNIGTQNNFYASRFTIANEEASVKEEKDWDEWVMMRHENADLSFSVTAKGILGIDDEDITSFLRAVLAKYDQLKQQ